MKTRFLARLQFLWILAVPAWADIPNVIPLQGRVSVNGENFNGDGRFKFAIYEAPNSSFSPAKATVNVTPSGAVADVTVLDGGSGYTDGLVVTIRPGLGYVGSGATATATVTGGVITGITVNNPGSGYSNSGVTRPTLDLDEPTIQTIWNSGATGSFNLKDLIEPFQWRTLPVNNGLYVAELGDRRIGAIFNTLPDILDTPVDGLLFVRVWFSDGVNGFQQLKPDIQLASTPFALQAKTALKAETAKTVMGTGQINGLSISGPGPNSSPANGAILPDSAGSQLFFNPGYGAFRAGNFATGFDVLNTGMESFAGGNNPIASGRASVALGNNPIAAGVDSVALGSYAEAQGVRSVAIGLLSKATGLASMALGYNSQAQGFSSFAAARGKAIGDYSVAIGYVTTAESLFEVVLGTNNVPGPTSVFGVDTWNTSDKLFSIGNGEPDGPPSDALVILKNGDTTLNGSLAIRDEIKYQTPKAGKIVIPGADFLPRDSSTSYGRHPSGTLYVLAESVNDDPIFQKAVVLPVGAVVTALRVRIRDEAANGITVSSTATLSYVGETSFAVVEMASATASSGNSNTSAVPIVQADTTINHATILGNRAYLVDLSIAQNGLLTLFPHRTGVFNVTIEYQVTNLQP